MRTRDRRIWVVVTIAVMTTGAALFPSTRYVSVDHVLTAESVPMWVKLLDFIDRDVNFGRVAEAALGSVDGAEARAMAALRWTRANVRPQPAELPVRDDHVWSVVVRGYGEPDQQADVFTTLLAYQDVPAYWTLIGRRPNELALSYVMLDGAWRVFDVAHGITFRRRDGALATREDVAADPAIVEAAATGVVPDIAKYRRYFDGYQPADAPDVLRADLQMPRRRLLHELKSLVGMEGRVWTIRPQHTAPDRGASR